VTFYDSIKEGMTKIMQPAVFLDRDGTINEQMGYINHLSRFRLLPRAAAAIRLLNEQHIPVVVVTNQSGLARGYFPEALLAEVHETMQRGGAGAGAHVDGIYICPHHAEAIRPEYRKSCDCRKPRTGLLTQAGDALDLDLARSYVVGDRWSDLQMAVKCHAKPVLVLTGYGRGDLAYIGPQRPDVRPAFVAEDIYEAVTWILADIKSPVSP